MVLGMSLATFTLVHVIISLIAIVAGIIVMFGMLGSHRPGGLTALFLLSPATRFGYFIYPISLYAWAVLADGEAARLARRASVDLDLPELVTAGAVGVGREAGLDEAVPAGRGR